MKSILICRTSTSRQEIDSQIKETKEFAIADGCDENDIVLLAKHGASAIKIDKAYQENMQRVYREIEAGGVGCVYAWALDRIGRNEVVMMQFKEFLVKHGVQLKIKNPALVLLNSDGTVNSGMEIAFTLYITLAKQEMEQKKARFERARKAKQAVGQFVGGRVLFGYMTDANGYLVENPETAPIVREAFHLYSTGEWGLDKLAEKMRYKGWPQCREQIMSFTIKNRRYIGESEGCAYPQLIDKDTFEKCQQIALRKSTNIGKTCQYWLAAKLITCPQCGFHFTQNHGKYRCTTHVKRLFPHECDCNITFANHKIDPLLYEVALPLEMELQKQQMSVNKEVLYAELNDLHKEIDNRQEEYDKRVKKAVDRINDLYADGAIDKDEWKERRAKAVAKADDLKDTISKLKLEADRKQRQIESSDLGGRTEGIFGYNFAMRAEEVSQMVHRHILDIVPQRVSDKEVLLSIQTTEGEKKFIYTNYKRTDNWQVWDANGEHTAFEVPTMEKNGEHVTFYKGADAHKWELSDEYIADLVNENE